jgi:hypothetical protein
MCDQTLKVNGRFHRPTTLVGPVGPVILLLPMRTTPALLSVAQARSHFFLPRRYRDPFNQVAVDFGDLRS